MSFFSLATFSSLILVVAQTAESEKQELLIRAFFGPSGIEDKKSQYTGEMLLYADQPTLGENLPPGISIAVRPLATSEVRSPFAVTLSKDGYSEDWYAYLRREEGRWKLEAVRSLALTGVPAMVFEELSKKEQRSSEEEWEYRNLMLLFSSDAELRSFASSKADSLERIRSLVREGNNDAAQEVASGLYLGDVRVDDANIEVMIGGVLDNTVGLLYVEEGKEPPRIDPRNHIYVEKAVGRWFLFKTT